MADDRSGQETLHGRTLLFGASLVLVGALAGRGYTKLALANGVEDVRVQSILDALPEVMKDPAPQVLLTGTSTASMEVSATIFDEAALELGAAVHLYNVGVPAASATGGLLLGRRIREAYTRANRRPAMVIIEFDPTAATRAWRATINGTQGETGMCALIRDREWYRELFTAPAETVNTALFCHVLGTPTAARGQGPVETWLSKEPSWWWGDKRPPPSNEAKLGQQMNRIRSQGFSVGNRGYQQTYPDDKVQVYEQLVKLQQDPAWMKKDVAKLVRRYDAEELRFDERYLADFITSVNEWKAFTTNVHVLVSVSNVEYVKPTPAGAARLAAAIERIRATGVPVTDLGPFSERFRGRFKDANHLDQVTAVPEYTKLIVAQLADSLRALPARTGSK